MTRVEWRKAPDFAEVAETLGVPTTSVFMIRQEGKAAIALYNQPGDDEELLSVVALRRDGDGILRAFMTPRRAPGLWEKIRREVLGG